MAQNSAEEIDFKYIYNLFTSLFKKAIVLGFQVLDFVLSKWKIVAILVLLGVGYGYYINGKIQPIQTAKILLRINFDSVDYVYGEVEMFNNKIVERDTVFLENAGFRHDTLEIKKGIKLSPVINLRDILDEYDRTGRNLDVLLRNLEFDSDVKVFETFNKNYKYHTLDLRLSHVANRNTVEKFISYINSSPIFEQIKRQGLKNIEERIASNSKIISQIDDVLVTYKTSESLASPSEQIYIVDKDFSVHHLIQNKMNLQKENEALKQEQIFSQDLSVVVNKSYLSKPESGILDNQMIFYPFFFIFIFLGLAFVRFSYFTLREIASSQKQKN